MSVTLCCAVWVMSKGRKRRFREAAYSVLIPENTVDGRLRSSSGRRSPRPPVNHHLLCFGMTLGRRDHGEIEMSFGWRECMPVDWENWVLHMCRSQERWRRMSQSPRYRVRG